MKAISKIERLLLERGWKQNAFEKAAVLAANRISKWKDGQGEPTLRQAFRMARLLHVPLEFLADDEQDAPPQSELTEDERAILDLYRALRLSKAEGLRRLATPSPPDEEEPASRNRGEQERRRPRRGKI